MTISEFKTAEITTENAVNWLKWINQSFDWDTLCYYFGKTESNKPNDVQQIDHVIMVQFKPNVNSSFTCLYNTNEPSHLELIQLEVIGLQETLNNRPFAIYMACDVKENIQ